MKDNFSLEAIKAYTKNTLIETLNIEFIEVTKDKVVASMPVNSRVHQPDGVLHGGASLALAETVGSFAAVLSVNRDTHMVRGIEISGNHLKSMREGVVIATAKPIHRGRTTQLWQIRIEDEEGKLVSLCKLSTIIIAKDITS